MKARRQLETIAGRVNADGTIQMGDGFTTIFGGAGVITVRFPGFRLISAQGNAAAIVMIDTFTENSCRFVTVNTVGGAGVSTPFFFSAQGYRV